MKNKEFILSEKRKAELDKAILEMSKEIPIFREEKIEDLKCEHDWFKTSPNYFECRKCGKYATLKKKEQKLKK